MPFNEKKMLKKLDGKLMCALRKIMLRAYPELRLVQEQGKSLIESFIHKSEVDSAAKLYPPFHVELSKIGRYTYIAQNAYVNNTVIGKFCSIGPNLICGWGIHPTNGISTSPMFYSTLRQNGVTLSSEDKVKENLPITIGNDVFIGANVTILDGVTIGDGAIVGAGAVVSKDIPSYAIAVGCPIRIKKYRFDNDTILKLNKIEWWNFDEERLKDIERMFFDVNLFIKNYNL